MRTILRRYTIVAASVTAALLVRWPFWSVLGTSVPYMTFFAAVIVSASRGGLAPGLLATTLSALAAAFFFVEPVGSFRIQTAADTLGLLLFGGIGAFISWVVDAQRKAQRLSEERLQLLTRRTTERKEAEEALRRANEKLDAIIRASPLPIIAFDHQATITLWNSAAERVFGWKEAEVLGKPLPYVPEGKQEEHRELLARALSGERFQDLEIRRQRKDGSAIDLSLSCAPLHDTAGRLVGVMNIMVDITQRKQEEDALRFANERLRRVNRELEEFTFVSSHDLREPLRMVNLYTQMLLRKLDLQDEVTNGYAHFINTGVGTMQRLIDDALAYSRVLHEEDTPHECADLNDSFQIAVRALAQNILEANADIESDLLPCVMADGREMAQVFQNVIDNALKYRKPHEQVKIRIAAVRCQREWVISVRDSGVGFRPEYSERIFGLFKRLHRRTDIPGTGLGLAISRRIAERHRGRMWAEGEPGVGATLYFALPADELEQANCG